MGERKNYHRGRRKKKKGGIISTLILIIAIAVFCVSGYIRYSVDIIRVNPNTTRFGKWRYMAMTRMKMNSW